MRPRAPAPPPWLPRTAASPRGAAHVREGRSRPLEGRRRLAHALGRHALKGLGADWFSSLV